MEEPVVLRDGIIACSRPHPGGLKAELAVRVGVDDHSYTHRYVGRPGMKTVQMTLDAELIAAVDRAATRLGTTRSGFTRDALRRALQHLRVRDMEARQRRGYARKPVRKGEFSGWEAEQAWPD